MVTIEVRGPSAWIKGELDPRIHQELYLQMSWPHARAIWRPHTLKPWDDGRISVYYPTTGKMPTGCVPRVEHLFRQLGIPYHVDRPTPPPNANLSVTKPNAMYPYQQEMHDAALKHFYGTLQAPARSGKTCVAAHWIATINRVPAMFMVNSIDLCYQAKSELSRWLNTEVGIIGDGVYEPKDITVVSVQSAFASLKDCGKARPIKAKDDTLREEKPLPNHEEAVRFLEACIVRVIDEVHLATAPSHQQVYRSMTSCCWSLGLSATPWSTEPDRVLIEAAAGPVIHITKKSDLIRAGRLVPIYIDLIKVPYIRYDKGTNYNTIYADYIVDNEWRNEQIARWCRAKHREGHATMTFVRYIRHAKDLAKRIGDNTIIVTGSVTGAERERIWNDLRERKIMSVVSTVGKYGLDIPVLDGVAMGMGGLSPIDTEQAVTRVMTPSPGKDHGHVLDFYDQARYLSSHSKERIALYCDDDAYNVRLIDGSL